MTEALDLAGKVKIKSNKLEKGFDLHVQYLYFEINFNFIYTVRFVTF